MYSPWECATTTPTETTWTLLTTGPDFTGLTTERTSHGSPQQRSPFVWLSLCAELNDFGLALTLLLVFDLAHAHGLVTILLDWHNTVFVTVIDTWAWPVWIIRLLSWTPSTPHSPLGVWDRLGCGGSSLGLGLFPLEVNRVNVRLFVFVSTLQLESAAAGVGDDHGAVGWRRRRRWRWRLVWNGEGRRWCGWGFYCGGVIRRAARLLTLADEAILRTVVRWRRHGHLKIKHHKIRLEN